MSTIVLDGVRKAYGDVVALHQLSLDVHDGEFIVLVGPSGCGKSTALKILAGLEEATSGKVFIGDRDVTDLAPGKRDIAMVFQNYALYPHLSVRGNMGFGLKVRGTDKTEIDARVETAARILGLEALLDRRPRALSGGQRQRVALGRAIVREPQAFLMDEPLSNLDAKLRVQMRSEITALHRRLGVTTVYVTHDQTEALTMASRIVIMRDGRVQQVADPDTMYRHPKNLFVASFIGSPGMNFFRSVVNEGRLRLAADQVELPARLAIESGREVIVGYRPEHVRTEGGDSTLELPVVSVEKLGGERQLQLELPESMRCGRQVGLSDDERDDRFVARVDGEYDISAGTTCRIGLLAERLHLFDPESGEAIVRHRGEPTR